MKNEIGQLARPIFLAGLKNAVWERDCLPPKLTSSPTLVKREEAGYLWCCDLITYCLVSTCSATGRCSQRRHCKPSSLSTRCGKIQVRITLKLQYSIHHKVLFSSPPSSPLLSPSFRLFLTFPPPSLPSPSSLHRYVAGYSRSYQCMGRSMGEDGTNTKTAQVTVCALKMYRTPSTAMWHMGYLYVHFLSCRSLSDVLLSQQGNKGTSFILRNVKLLHSP